MIQYQDEVPAESQRTRSCRSDEVPEQSRYVIPEPCRSYEVPKQSRCVTRAEQIPVQSCYGPRAVQVLRRFQWGTMMIVSVGNNESDQVRLDQIQTSLIYSDDNEAA